jgi:hypothetical protein
MSKSDFDLKINSIKNICERIENDIFDKEYLKYENKEVKSTQEYFYKMMLMAVPTFNFKNK